MLKILFPVLAALSQIDDQVFQLMIHYALNYANGTRMSVYGQAVHPSTRKPVSGLEWNALILVGGKDLAPAQMIALEEGFVEFVFDIPESYERNRTDFGLNVSGRLGDFEQKASVDGKVYFYRQGSIQSDKPLYQPGQTMRLRAVVLDEKRRAAQGEEFNLRIVDSRGKEVHNSRFVSSKFGIVSEDWTIPDAASTGQYGIYLRDANWNTVARHRVRVSRYELPNFKVTATPDRTFYLPTETPLITVSGKYLFGKPVTGRHVRILRIPENSREEDEGETIAEGDAGQEGTCSETLDLNEDYESLEKYSGLKRFEDIRFVANYTDRTTGRTEQCRFGTRISLEPVHVYVVAGSGEGTSYLPGAESETMAKTPKFGTIERKIGKLQDALDRYNLKTLSFPRNEADLSVVSDWNYIPRDPWGEPYREEFGIEYSNYVIRLHSSGPDKQFGTRDDYIEATFSRNYFELLKHLIDEAVKNRDYPANVEELDVILREHGLLLSALHDPWGTPYRADILTEKRLRYVGYRSAGPDRRFDTYDDVTVASFTDKYFKRKEARTVVPPFLWNVR